jgi:hypothetical protein
VDARAEAQSPRATRRSEAEYFTKAERSGDPAKMIQRKTFPDGRVELRSSRGSFELAGKAPQIYLATFRGHCDAALGDASIEEQTRILPSRGQVLIFTDCEEMTGYDSDVRVRFTEWSIQNRDRLGHGQVLLRSKIVAMAVSVVSLATGRPSMVQTKRGMFEKALADAIARGARSARVSEP